MGKVFDVLIAILGLAVLMIVHEAGHFLAARAYGMRVNTFSIGFGPTFFKVEPQDGYFWFTTLAGKVRLRLGKHDPERHGPTVYQAAMIPFLAYVQIAGMNPFEEHDPDDAGSYANASLLGRVVTIFGGPLANYLFASVFFFFSYFHGGLTTFAQPTEAGSNVVDVMAGEPAEKAGLRDGDVVVEVAGKKVSTWEDMAKNVSSHPGESIEVVVEREGTKVPLAMTPRRDDRNEKKGIIGVRPRGQHRAVSAGEAAKLAVTSPAAVVQNLVIALGDMITGKVKPDVHGPVTIISEGAKMVRRSFTDWLHLMGVLSAYLGAFNLIPFPALDGGRLVFLGYELTTRRKPNARIEAHIHVVGLMMLLGVMLYVTIFNDLKLGR
ncbi:MAG: site-2 protease family protein [Deltaproteobacteria bacterium]|nr:site-2 protease family protein [Deltaproteobacteria bacterium]